MALAAYLTATRQLVGDPAAQRYSDANLTTFINTGRSQLALEGECVRFVYGLDGILFTGSFIGTNVITSVSPAAAAVLDNLTGWVVSMLNATTPGTTVVSYTGTTMTLNLGIAINGTFTFLVSPPNATVLNQERYNSPTSICLTNGVKDAIGIRGVSINYGSYGANQYTLRFRDWTTFQAYWRTYNNLSGNPTDWTRYENVKNTIYLRPIPSAVYPMQWDCTCSVVNLTDDTTPEAIPYSYTDSIPYFAAYLALMSSQRKDDAQNMLAIYERFTKIGRRNFQSTIVPDVYEGS